MSSFEEIDLRSLKSSKSDQCDCKLNFTINIVILIESSFVDLEAILARRLA
jgi:hypothetical protein